MQNCIRPETLEQLKRLGQETGDPYFFIDLVRSFLGSAEVAIEKLKVYVAFSDNDLVRNTAHALKSSSGNLGAQGMYEICYSLEKLGAAHEVQTAGALVDKLEQEFNNVQAAFRVEIARSYQA